MMVRIKDDEHFLCEVDVILTPFPQYEFTSVEAHFYYEQSEHEDVKHVPNFIWWVDIDIVTEDAKEALIELRKEKYEASGASETF
jgi:hypothetical protein